MSAVLKEVRPAYFAGVSLKVERFDHKRLPCAIFLRELTGPEGDVYRKFKDAHEQGFPVAVMYEFLSHAICTEDGERYYANPKEATEELKKLPYTLMRDIFFAALTVGALTPDGVEEEKKT